MKKNTATDSELFFWVKSGQENRTKRIHGIHHTKAKTIPPKTILKKPRADIDSARAGLKRGWIRATFIVREDNLKKIKALAYWDRRDIKQILDEALNSFLDGKEIKTLPEPEN